MSEMETTNYRLEAYKENSFCFVPKETSACYTPLKDRTTDKSCFQTSVCKKMSYLIEIIIIS